MAADDTARGDRERPTAEEMLARLQREEEERRRGRLRVYLGAAPGVGKTYAMLEEGHRLRAEGHDVIIGFVETYGRAETEAMIGDLEIVPRRNVEYRGVVLEEMDFDAILARHPEIVLIDELAHTNAPGSARERRYEDVEALLDVGINVITTMNIQHLESINDLVESVTGVTVRETVPDRILESADVEVVDLPPSILRERLMAGKIYPREQAIRALENFFRESNLTALRELALRQAAEGVEATLESYMREEQVPGPWPTIERVLVAFDERDDEAAALIRRAWRLAHARRAPLLALCVLSRPLERLSDGRQRSVRRYLDLAADLGAETITVVARDVVEGLVRVAAAQRVTDIVIAPPRENRRQRWLGRAPLSRLLEALPGVDVHIIAAPAPETRPGS